jgi:hypothetical protein
MKFLIAAALVASACGNSGSSGPDAAGGGGDDDGGDSTGDGLSAGPHTIELTLTNRPNTTATYSFIVAYQDGSAEWKLAPTPSGDKYSFEVTAPSYGVMYACIGIGSSSGGGFTQTRAVNLAYFAVGERTSVTLDVPQRCSDRMQNTVTLSGSVTNRTNSGAYVVQYGTRQTQTGSISGLFSMQVPLGTRDLFVYHFVPEGNGDFRIDDVVTMRDVAVAGPTSKTIDFSTAQEPDVYDVTVNVPSMNTRVVASTTLYTANGTQGSITRETGNWESDALPSALRRPTDVYDQSIAVLTLGHGASVTNATSSPGAQDYVAPAPLGDVTASIATSNPYMTIDSAWRAYNNAVGYTWTAMQEDGCPGSATCAIVWTAYLSPGVLGAQPAFRMPDLSTLTSWKSEYEFANNAVGGSVTAITSTAGAMDFPTAVPAAGTQRSFVRTDFDVAP